MWELRYNRDGWSVEEGFAKGREAPDWWDEQPELLRGDREFMTAFWHLDTERTSHGKIPWSKVMQYADMRGYTADVRDVFWRCIDAMDRAYRNWMSTEIERDSRKGRARGPRSTASGGGGGGGGRKGKRRYRR